MSVSGSEKAPVVVHGFEDDESSRVASSRVLKTAGYVVRAYATADDFLAQLPTEAGCIVLDLRLPGPSGLGSSLGLNAGRSFAASIASRSASPALAKASFSMFVRKP